MYTPTKNKRKGDGGTSVNLIPSPYQELCILLPFSKEKGCSCLLILLITAEVANYAACVGYRSEERRSLQGTTFFLRQLHNKEYIPPIPVRYPNPFVTLRHVHPLGTRETLDTSLNKREWIPLVYPDGRASSTREMFVHPLGNKERISVKESSPEVVTNKPETFDIPLRKSIQVSHPFKQPSIQTKGYMKEVIVKKVPLRRPTPKPMHAVFVDNVRHTTAQSMVNVTTFDDNWKPKRITTKQPRSKMSRKLNPVPFTRFSDSHSNNSNMKSETPKVSNEQGPLLKSSGGNIQENGNENNKPLLDVDNSYTKFVNGNSEIKDPYFVSSIKLSGENENIKDLEHKFHTPMFNSEIPFHPQTLSDLKNGIRLINDDNAGQPDRKQLFIGVEYADSEFHGIKDNSSQRTIKFNDGNTKSQETIQDNRNDKGSSQELQNQSPPPDVVLFATNKFNKENNGTKINKYIKSSGEKHVLDILAPANYQTKSLTSDSATVTGIKNSNSKENEHFSKPFTEEPKYETSESHFSVDQTKTKAPFYGDIHGNDNTKLYSKEVQIDKVYFPQIFPDTRRAFGTINTNNSTLIKSVTSTVDNERLLEYNGKQNHKARNGFKTSVHRTTHYSPPNTATTKGVYSSPTSPSLITVAPDNSDLILDASRTRNKANRTDTYVLQRKPSLFPANLDPNPPRKPNIKISSGMLAGILIAALIFLGFLTGTMVFAFHQLKFGSRRSKKPDRHKKRTTVYAPEYLDETFAGNTYIHNNIFLPNPQNIEERLSAEMDTSFSVDSDETTQAADPQTTSYGSTRHKHEHRYDESD
ncbi:uncharacterized protein CDAR_452321 [Caerostris darwini]|uniref:Uncharacterized protein n=1 Tax=Caerostris darwini TaxID=1538125 RepID=A0AAV4VQY1_9ARAC|nr:uncharacterized protein CDAR_452321 [Caerostris darwini]